MDEINIQISDLTNDEDYLCFDATAQTAGSLLGKLQYVSGYGDTAEEAFDDLIREIQNLRENKREDS